MKRTFQDNLKRVRRGVEFNSLDWNHLVFEKFILLREESQIKLSGNLPLNLIFLKGGGGLAKNTTQTSKSVCFYQKLAGLWKKIRFSRYFLKGFLSLSSKYDL